jgi:translation initiation factor eIF-2B subunit alpha/methylthioribose-1-phosphate isomerase
MFSMISFDTKPTPPKFYWISNISWYSYFYRDTIAQVLKYFLVEKGKSQGLKRLTVITLDGTGEAMKVNIEGEQRDVRSVWMEDTKVNFIDQRILPHRFEIYSAEKLEDVAYAIKDMVVRGAPAIGAGAAYGMAQAKMLGTDLNAAQKVLRATRPTAQDLFTAIDFMQKRMEEGIDPKTAAERYVDGILDSCRRIGEHGQELIKDKMKILTHCNAGALATVDHGTALAPIRFAFYQGKNIFVYVDETRPRLQGARLTAWELNNEGIPHALIADNAAGHFMHQGDVDMVIVGADRIAKNGDFANKIGTYEKAVLAFENKIPFYVAAPLTTFDFSLADGNGIPIEERGEDEVLIFRGERIAPMDTKVRNPAFDVTPARYVTGYITESGIVKAEDISNLENQT